MSGNAIFFMILIFAVTYGGLAYFINLSLKGDDDL
jgi:hypothetical protein